MKHYNNKKEERYNTFFGQTPTNIGHYWEPNYPFLKKGDSRICTVIRNAILPEYKPPSLVSAQKVGSAPAITKNIEKEYHFKL